MSAFRIEGDAAVIADDAYRRTRGSEARVDLLRAAAAAAARVVVSVPIADAGTHLGRVAIDLPRRILGIREPGDRGEVHVFFDEEALYDEIGRAGLGVASRSGSTFVLTRAARREGELADPFVVELARAARTVRAAEAARASGSPDGAIAAMRARGRRTTRRGPVGRARLRRAIGWVDALVPSGANCYRRTLLELALDAGAAEETIVFGLDIGRTGHVAFADREDATFDVAFAIADEKRR
jgi:hypothetical protein